MNTLFFTHQARGARIRMRKAFTVVVSCLVFHLSGVAFAGEQPEHACPKGEILTEEGCARNPRIIHKTRPVYPFAAKTHGVEGSVILEVRLTEEGKIDTITVKKAKASDSSYTSMLSDAATKAVRKWRFAPGTLNGTPRAVTFTTQVDFRLDR